MALPSLTLCMIVRDEAHFLPQCLRNAEAHVDEIVIVDTGSTDETATIARRFTDRVFEYAWHDDFAAARNFALEQAQGDWIISLDADEMIAPEDWRRLRALITGTALDAFFLTEHNYTRRTFEGGFCAVSRPTPYTRDFPGYKVHHIARLFRNRPDIRFRGHVHELIDGSLSEGQYEISDIVIHHYGEDSPERPTEQRQLNYLRLMERDLASDPSGRLFAAAASIRLHFVKDYGAAIAHYDKAIEYGWQVDACRENRALARYLAGELDQAYSDYKALHASGYRSINLCINLANLAVKRSETAFAVALLEEAVGLGIVDPRMRMQIDHNIRYLREQLN